jgi:hypothetical protein
MKNDSVSVLLPQILHTHDACVHKASACRDVGCVDWLERIACSPIEQVHAFMHTVGGRNKALQ